MFWSIGVNYILIIILNLQLFTDIIWILGSAHILDYILSGHGLKVWILSVLFFHYLLLGIVYNWICRFKFQRICRNRIGQHG